MLLIADTKLKRGRDLADMLRWMGIVALADKPMNVLCELRHSISALIVVNPHELPDARDYISKVRSYARTLPLFAISDQSGQDELSHLFLRVFTSNIMTSTLVSVIRDEQARAALRPLGDYIFAGVDASCTHDDILCRGRSVSMTARQKMILRYLLTTYPERVSPDAIARHVYRPGTEPEDSCIRAHICAINKKIGAILGHPVIDSLRSSGYRVVTAEVLRRRTQGIVD